MHVFFYHIHCWVQRHKALSTGIAILFLLLFGFLASKIRFEEDITQIIPKSEKTDLTTKVMRQMNFSDKITVLIEPHAQGTLDDAIGMAQKLVDTFAVDTAYIREVTGQIDAETATQVYDFVFQHLPLFLDGSDYDSLAYRISPPAIASQVEQNYYALLTPSSFVSSSFIEKDPLGLGWMGMKKLQQASVGGNFILYDGFITTKDSAQVLLFLSPSYEGSEASKNQQLARYLDGVQKAANKELAEKVSVSFFGAALVAAENADQIKGDILKTVLISMSVLVILLIVFYRNFLIPLLVFIPTVFAAVFALGCLYLYKPVISAISLSIGAVLIGITIDYALHILTHYKKNEDVKELYKELTRPLLMSGTTNAIVFLCLLFVHSTALVDLGIFAAIALVSSAVFTLLIIPHLYRPKKELKHNSLLDRLAAFPFERSKILIGICLLLIVVSLFTGEKVKFDNDLSKLNYMSIATREVENKLDKLMNTSARSLYIVATANTLDTALQRNEEIAHTLHRAKLDKQIIDYSTVSELMLPQALQQRRIAQWNTFWQQHDKEGIKQLIQQEGQRYGFEQDAHAPFYEMLEKDFQPVDPSEFTHLPSVGSKDFVSERAGFYMVTSLVKLDESRRGEIVRKFADQKDIVVIDRKQLNETFLGKLKDDFNTLVGYSSIAVLLILWLFFRRIELVLLAAIPIALTGLVTAGLMGLFDLEFNIFSAIVCTLVFGHGVDFSIFMTAALQKQYTTGKDELQVYRTSILLAVLTTVLAIGALIFARHPALISISSVSLIGVFAAVIITFVFYPLIFRFFITDRAKRGKSPFTIGILLWSLLFFTYYGLGCIVLSFLARFVFPWLPLPKEKKDRFLRRMISTFMKSVLYGHPLTRNQTLNPTGEAFEKPAVVIGNHSSFLDTLTMGMLVPKMIFLVNDWVWKSPIFGRAVRALGFYPVRGGVEESISTLRSKVEQGYSVVIFPEGTRSYDNVPGRFHKGAFYLAEQLQLDIVPIYIHGNGDVLPKGDFLIFKGNLTPVIGGRIMYEDRSFGQNYSGRTKNIARYFKNEWDNLRLQLEDENYFIRKIQLAYLYKDDDIIRSVKHSLQKWKSIFWKLNTVLDKTELEIVHLSEGYGELDYLLSLQQGKRKITGITADEEKCHIAESIYWARLRRVKFTCTSAEGPVLLLSKTLDGTENLNWEKFSKIININNKNNLYFILNQNYTQQVIDTDIHIYTRHERDTYI